LISTSEHHWLVLGVASATLVSVGLLSRDRPLAKGFFFTAMASAAESSIGESGSLDMSPGVIADPAAERLYLMNSQGGIDAIGLASGNLLWTSRAAGKPLAVFDDRLAAQADPTGGSSSLPIVLLDTKSGRVVSNIAIPMPPGVMPPSINDKMGTSSSVKARADHDGLLVWWTITGRGISPIPGPVNVRNYSGAALINLHTNSVTTLASDQADAMLRGKTSAATPSLSGAEGVYFPPQRVDGLFVSVKLGSASVGQPAVLKRWRADGGEPLPDIELGPGFVASSISADRSLFLSVSDSTPGQGYLWSLYSIADWKRVAEVHLADSASPFFVWHSILIYKAMPAAEEPTRLRGLNLKTGTQIWTRALRDTAYHGPYPPQR
jgi:hypothetical protein